MLFEAERLIANLYLARKAVKEARRIRNEKFSEIGECEYFEIDNGNGSLCCYRWPSQQNKWCDYCLERQPYHDDYRQKSIKSTVALKAVLNFGKKLANKIDSDRSDADDTIINYRPKRNCSGLDG